MMLLDNGLNNFTLKKIYDIITKVAKVAIIIQGGTQHEQNHQRNSPSAQWRMPWHCCHHRRRRCDVRPGLPEWVGQQPSQAKAKPATRNRVAGL